MTDGNMATISPVSEGEMEQIQTFFKRAVDTMLAFSSLSSEVEKLRAQVNDLSNQVTRYRNHIDTQDDAMYRLRQEREELTRAKEDAVREATEAKHNAEQAASRYDTMNAQVTNLQAHVQELMKARDDAELRGMELEDKLKKAEGDLGKFREFARSMLPEVKLVEDMPASPPQGAPTPIAQTELVEHVDWWSKPTAFTTAPAEPPKEPEPEAPVDPWTSAQRATS